MQQNLRKHAALLAIVAIVALLQGGLIGTAMSVHHAGHDHDSHPHPDDAAILLILHGHYHDGDTPQHRHPHETAKPVVQLWKHSGVSDSPVGALLAVPASTPRCSLASRRGAEAHRPNLSAQAHRSVVLRI